jgi:hypothetical protein
MTQVIPQTTPDFDRARIIERPDGFYWQSKDADREYGPFATLLEAVNDMQYRDDSDYEEGESLAEAEDELGITEWIDGETGHVAGDGDSGLEDH